MGYDREWEELEREKEWEISHPEYDSDGNEVQYDEHDRAYVEDNEGDRHEPE